MSMTPEEEKAAHMQGYIEGRADMADITNRAFATIMGEGFAPDTKALLTIKFIDAIGFEAKALEIEKYGKPHFRVVAPSRQVDAGQEY